MNFSTSPAKPPRRRRWLRYSLRSLLLVTTLSAIVLGVWVVPAERQRRAVAAIRELRGVVCELTELNSLLLSGTQVTNAGCDTLQQALPKCAISH